MNIYHLKSFYAISCEGSISRAAVKLHVSQPTISAQMQALEQSLGVRLFDRTGQGIRLTDSGETLLRYTQQILDLIDEAELSVRRHSLLQSGRLRLVASSLPGNYLLPPLMARFKNDHPGIELFLRIENSRRAAELVLSGEAELGAVGQIESTSGLDVALIEEDELACIASPSHPLRDERGLSAADVARFPLLMREPGSGTRAVTEQIFRENGVPAAALNIQLELAGAEAIRLALKAGGALAVLSRLSAADQLRLGELVELDCPALRVSRPISMISRAGQSLTPPAAAFARLMRPESRAGG